MSRAMKSTLNLAKPWRSGQLWWIVALEGVVAIGLGIWIWINTAGAIVLGGQLTALFLLIVGALGLWAQLRRPLSSRVAQVGLVRSTIGLLTGLLIFLLLWLNVLTLDAGLVILAIGMLLFGALGAYVVVADEAPGTRYVALITSIVFAIVGVLLLVRPGAGLFRVALGVPLIGGGVALLALAAWIWSRGR